MSTTTNRLLYHRAMNDHSMAICEHCKVRFRTKDAGERHGRQFNHEISFIMLSDPRYDEYVDNSPSLWLQQWKCTDCKAKLNKRGADIHKRVFPHHHVESKIERKIESKVAA